MKSFFYIAAYGGSQRLGDSYGAACDQPFVSGPVRRAARGTGR